MNDRPVVTLRSTSIEDTRALAGVLAAALAPGDVVALTGELGAGKTCFVQGAAAALGIERRVVSPTFMLVRTYDGALPIVHCDVYRLDTLQQVYDLGDEVFSPDAVTFIEWGDAVEAILPEDHLEVELLLEDPHDVDADRHVALRGHGSWHDRLPVLAAELAPWTLHPPQES